MRWAVISSEPPKVVIRIPFMHSLSFRTKERMPAKTKTFGRLYLPSVFKGTLTKLPLVTAKLSIIAVLFPQPQIASFAVRPREGRSRAGAQEYVPDSTSLNILVCGVSSNYGHPVSRPELRTIEERGQEQASQMSVSSHAIDLKKDILPTCHMATG